MLGIMFQKLLSKKWIFLCLLLGSVLLTATLVSFPMYESAVFDRMLRSEFKNSLADTGEWPATLVTEVIRTNADGVRQSVSETDEEMANFSKRLGVEILENIHLNRIYCHLALKSGRRDINIDYLYPAMLTDLPDHATILSGEMYSEDGLSEDGCIEVVISENCMADSNLLLDDILQFNLSDGSAVSFKIVGIFRKNEDRYYWEAATDQLPRLCLMQEEQFRKIFLSGSIKDYYSVSFYHYIMFDYEQLKANQASPLKSVITKSSYEGDTCVQLLDRFLQKQPLISATLFLLEIPVLILLGAFLFMVSGQMYELEKNEISVIKSRGSSAFQIFRLYLYQNLFLTSLGTALGLLLGIYFVRILGSASNFLEFGLRRNLDVHFEPRLWLYAAASALATVLIMTLPAIRHSKVSIVHLKQKKNARKRPLWEYFCLDIICLGIGYYGYYNYTHDDSRIVEFVLGKQSMDPLLYLSSSLFIVGAGLLFLRLQPLLVRLVYVIGKRFWHPASYASFLDNLKNGRKQQFIMLFLILTVSLGTLYATVARTILQNALNNVEYLDGGADIIIKEIWKNNLATIQRQRAAAEAYPDAGIPVERPRYYEADFAKYDTLNAKLCTKVFYDDRGDDTPGARCYITEDLQSNTYTDVTFMGIHTKEFGESTWLNRELTEKHFYTYLNTLADNPEGILVSRNFQTDLGYKAGDQIWCCYQPCLENEATNTLIAKYTILDFVDYWPGFAPSETVVSESEGVFSVSTYLVVANAATLQDIIPSAVIPYEVWITLEEGMDSSDVVQWINDNDVKVEKYVDLQADLQETMEDPLLQGTNGILTMSFLVMLLLCGVGYLIYWVMSIRSRELIFGTLRAFGMHKGELFHILILEQIFSGILSLLAGIGIGRLASDIYVPLLQTAYAAANQVLPIKLLTNAQDMVRLYGTLALMMVFCLTVLVILVLRLNITKALKLGEE